MDPMYFPTRICEENLTRFGQIMKCVWVRKVAFTFGILPRHWFSSYYCSHSLSRQPVCTVSASKSPTFSSAGLCIRNRRPPRSFSQAQASHRGLERPSELQLDSSCVSPIPLGTIRGFISIRQPSHSPFSQHVAGAQPYLAIKVQGNILRCRRWHRNCG